MKVATHEKLDVTLRGLQGMKWVDVEPSYDLPWFCEGKAA